ncbi:MAG: galactose mutarotase [Clostridiales bacterium]|nr:galactose mutarotase [Clostridiales bacterium]
MEKQAYGKTEDGREATLYTISNGNGMKAQLLDYGATLVSLIVPDRDGKPQDVVLGYTDVAEYESHTSYFGATVGRNCNRISDAKFTLDGVEYQVDVNDNENNLHSGKTGTSMRYWTVKDYAENRITFSIEDANLTQGFPGDAVMEVTYAITDDNGLSISYYGKSDKKTVFNMTNHAYFNLNGHASGNVLEQTLKVNASHYNPLKSAKAIPTGENADVAGTPFDFREEKTIGRDIKQDNVQLSYPGGYDHNFVLDRKGDGMETAAVAYGPKTGIRMEVITDCIAMQLYTANTIGDQAGKGGAIYPDYGAMCLETQYCPNAINEPNFVSPITGANEEYRSKTIYRFSVA